jgi:hypothetical protein
MIEPNGKPQESRVFIVFVYRGFLPGVIWLEHEYFFVSTEYL